MKRIIAALLLTLGIATAAPANAVHFDCQVSGVLIVVALNGPVTVCSVDTDATNTNTLDPTINASLLPHL